MNLWKTSAQQRKYIEQITSDSRFKNASDWVKEIALKQMNDDLEFIERWEKRNATSPLPE